MRHCKPLPSELLALLGSSCASSAALPTERKEVVHARSALSEVEYRVERKKERRALRMAYGE